MRRSQVVLPIALFAAGLLVGGFGLRWLVEQGLAEFWQRQCASISDDQALPLMRQLAAGDQQRLRNCVAALGLPRSAMAEAARRALLEAIGAWRQLPAHESLQRREWLARALAQSMERLAADRQCYAAELARAILAGPDSPQVNASRLVGDCEYVLRIEAQRRGPASAPAESLEWSARERVSMDAEAAARDLLAWTQVAGGGLPSPRPAASEAAPGVVSEPQVAQEPRIEPGLLSAAANARPVEVLRQPSAVLAAPDGERPGGGSTHRTTGRPAPRPGEMRRLSLEQREGPAEDRRELQSTPVRELFARLHDSAVETAAKARIELESRGFTKLDFELARQLVDPNPAVRRQLVEALPGLSGVQPAPWLLWLCEDSDPEVALAAASWIATTGDPGLWAQLESIAAQQADPRIRRVLEQCQRKRAGRADRGR